MKRSIGLLAVALTVLLLGFTTPAPAQSSPAKGTVIVPESSVPHPGGVSTNVLLFVPDEPQPGSYPSGENPGSLACIYDLVKQTSGCKTSNSNFPSGGSKAIALVDYGDDPDAETDIDTFATTFGLPKPSFTKVCVPKGQTCSQQGSWALEESLDIEYSFGMAPNAKIYLVEASDNSSDLYGAEDAATKLVAAAGGGEISNSWIYYGEYSGENADDKHFKHKGIVYLAASGDEGGGETYVGYPCTSPFVVCAGGTTINRDSSGDFQYESGWSGAGGGTSHYEPRPKYQNVIKKLVGKARGVPDMAADANPFTGVAVYSTDYCGGWCVVGGTSVASPTLAGIINSDGEFMSSSTAELTQAYSEYPGDYGKYWTDITQGNNGYACDKGWDFCTGIGSVLTSTGK